MKRRRQLAVLSLRIPSDWLGRIMERKADDQSAADFCRELLRAALDDEPGRRLSPTPIKGRPRG